MFSINKSIMNKVMDSVGMVSCIICKKEIPEEEAKYVWQSCRMLSEMKITVCEVCFNKLINEQVPATCVLLKECGEIIGEDVFKSLCYTPRWIYCEKATEEAKKYHKKPIEWLIITFCQKMPNDWLKPKVAKKKRKFLF